MPYLNYITHSSCPTYLTVTLPGLHLTTLIITLIVPGMIAIQVNLIIYLNSKNEPFGYAPALSTHLIPKNYLKKLNTLNIFDINKVQTGIFMHRFLNNNIPKSFENYFHKHNDIHHYNTRNAENLISVKPTSNLIKNSIKYIGPKLWNSLDSNLKTSKTTKSFKVKYKTEIISNY